MSINPVDYGIVELNCVLEKTPQLKIEQTTERIENENNSILKMISEKSWKIKISQKIE